MTVSRGLFVRQVGAVGTTPVEGRRALAGLLHEGTPGVPRSGLLRPSDQAVVSGTTEMSYNIAPCTVVANRTAGEGTYLFSLTGTTNTGVVTSAPGSGSRIDLIWAKQNDPEKGDLVAGSPDNTALVGVVVGQASGTPVAPYAEVPVGAVVLAESLVTANATQTAALAITQVYPFTVTRGNPLPVRNQAERDALPYKWLGLRVSRLDRGGLIQTYDGSRWEGELRMTSEGATLQASWVKSGTVSVATDANGAGAFIFAEPFPNRILGAVYTQGTQPNLGLVNFRYDETLSTRSRAAFFLYDQAGGLLRNLPFIRMTMIAWGD